MENVQISIVYGLNQNLEGTEPGFFISPDDITFIKDKLDGKLYIGNDTEILDEVKTDKSNNWAKMFFYGGS
jgi:hypothetical protein